MANKMRETSSQQLGILQKFTAELHQAADVEDVVFRVLEVMVRAFGYEHAVVGLVDLEAQVISNWLDHHDHFKLNKQVPSSFKLSLDDERGGVATAVLTHQIQQIEPDLISAHDALNQYLNMKSGLIVPMSWGVQSVGVLLISGATLHDERLQTIQAIASQTAVSIGMMRTRLRRAQASALKEERARIALDIHDSVSQSLFGLVLTLEGTLKLLDSRDIDVARTELVWAINSARQVRQQIQQTIHDNWTEEMTALVFEGDLQKYVVDVLQASQLAIVFDIRGDFSTLSPQAQRTLYRISQESLTNIVHHAAATNARVCVDIFNQFARLVVRDNGRGFEPTVALTQNYDQEHFGLRGMQDRTRSLGGTCDIFSQPNAGTSIVVEFPL